MQISGYEESHLALELLLDEISVFDLHFPDSDSDSHPVAVGLHFPDF